MNKYQQECLTVLMEECGEVIQEICKILRFGLEEYSHHDVTKTHLECLQQELGDLLAMIQMLRDSELGLTDEGLKAAYNAKLVKVKQWMKHKKPPTKKE